MTELKNADKEKEDQQEKDAQDRKEGFLTYVGESVLENETPWYAIHRDIERETDKEKITKGVDFILYNIYTRYNLIHV